MFHNYEHLNILGKVAYHTGPGATHPGEPGAWTFHEPHDYQSNLVREEAMAGWEQPFAVHPVTGMKHMVGAQGVWNPETEQVETQAGPWTVARKDPNRIFWTPDEGVNPEYEQQNIGGLPFEVGDIYSQNILQGVGTPTSQSAAYRQGLIENPLYAAALELGIAGGLGHNPWIDIRSLPQAAAQAKDLQTRVQNDPNLIAALNAKAAAPGTTGGATGGAGVPPMPTGSSPQADGIIGGMTQGVGQGSDGTAGSWLQNLGIAAPGANLVSPITTGAGYTAPPTKTSTQPTTAVGDWESLGLGFESTQGDLGGFQDQSSTDYLQKLFGGTIAPDATGTEQATVAPVPSEGGTLAPSDLGTLEPYAAPVAGVPPVAHKPFEITDYTSTLTDDTTVSSMGFKSDVADKIFKSSTWQYQAPTAGKDLVAHPDVPGAPATPEEMRLFYDELGQRSDISSSQIAIALKDFKYNPQLSREVQIGEIAEKLVGADWSWGIEGAYKLVPRRTRALEGSAEETAVDVATEILNQMAPSGAATVTVTGAGATQSMSASGSADNYGPNEQIVSGPNTATVASSDLNWGQIMRTLGTETQNFADLSHKIGGFPTSVGAFHGGANMDAAQYRDVLHFMAQASITLPAGITWEPAKYGKDGNITKHTVLTVTDDLKKNLTPEALQQISTALDMQGQAKEALLRYEEGAVQFHKDLATMTWKEKELIETNNFSAWAKEQDAFLSNAQLAAGFSHQKELLVAQAEIDYNVLENEQAFDEWKTGQIISSDERIANLNAATSYSTAAMGATSDKEIAALQADSAYSIAEMTTGTQAGIAEMQSGVDVWAAKLSSDTQWAIAQLNSSTKIGLEGTFGQKVSHDIDLLNRGHDQKIYELTHSSRLEMGLETHKGNIDLVKIEANKYAELELIGKKYELEGALQVLRDSGEMDRLVKEIVSNELIAGHTISGENARAAAEIASKAALQEAQLSAMAANLSTEALNALNQIEAAGFQDRLTQEAKILADQLLETQRGEHALAAIGATGVQDRATMVKKFELEDEQLRLREELRALPTLDTGSSIELTRQVSQNYTTTLNNAISQAATSGNYDVVNEALAHELPPMPVGIQWSRDEGGFRMRPGYEGRQMDADTREWISTATTAYKARDRVEQAVQQANLINIELQAKRLDESKAAEQFREHMMTADIDSAEEAAARHKMAETAALASQTKLEHLQMLFGLLQNPIQLGMAKRHGLLGQIEAVLGFTINNVPSGPVGGAGTVPTVNEWQTMDSEEQTFSLALFVEQGGSPDEFLRLIAAAAPAQMQQLQYGVL